MAFQIAVQEVIMIFRHKRGSFSCLKINCDSGISHRKMYSKDIILSTSLYEGGVESHLKEVMSSYMSALIPPVQSYVSPVIQAGCATDGTTSSARNMNGGCRITTLIHWPKYHCPKYETAQNLICWIFGKACY